MLKQLFKIKNVALQIFLWKLIFPLACYSIEPQIIGNTIYFSTYRIQVLSKSVLRIQKKVDYAFPKSDYFTENNLFASNTEPKFLIENKNNEYVIRTGELKIKFSQNKTLENGGIQIESNGISIKRLIDVDNKNLGGTAPVLEKPDQNYIFTPQKEKKEILPDIIDSQYVRKFIPHGVLSASGYTILNFSKRDSVSVWQFERCNDYILLLYGNNYKQAWADLNQITGSIPLLPRWSLGVIYSDFYPRTSADFKEIITNFRNNGMALDALVGNFDATRPTYFNVDNSTYKFSDFDDFANWCKSVNLTIGTADYNGYENINIVNADDPTALLFTKSCNIDTVLSKRIINNSLVFNYNPLNEKHVANYLNYFVRPKLEKGSSFVWLEGNTEFVFIKAYHDLIQQVTNKRSLVFSNNNARSIIGLHQYPCEVIGDINNSWDLLFFEVEKMIKGSNNETLWSNNIGGFNSQSIANNGAKTDIGELYARSIQLGAFSPFMRLHLSRYAGSSEIAFPWSWDKEVLKSAQRSIQLRKSLLPYIYSQTRISHETGIPMCRGLYIDFPNEKGAYRYNEYMFGSEFLIAPITDRSQDSIYGAARKNVWLPNGNWIDFFTDERYEGNGFIPTEKGLDELPVFVREGAIIPMRENGLKPETFPYDTIRLHLYQPLKSANNSATLYEDDGVSFDFRNDIYLNYAIDYAFCSTDKSTIQKQISENSTTLTINPPLGKYKLNGQQRVYIIEIHCSSIPTSVVVNGVKCTQSISQRKTQNSWFYNNQKKRTTIVCRKTLLSDGINVEVTSIEALQFQK